MLRQLMIYYIKVYSLPRSQAMRFDSKHQSHCLSCIFSQKIQFAFVDCSSICKQCLCIYKGSNTHGIANLPCVFCLLGCNPNPCEHHASVMAAHSCGVLKERFAKTRSLHRHDAEHRVWAAPNKFLQRKWSLYIQRHCLQESFAVPEWYHKALLAEAIVPVRIVNSACNCYTGLIKNFSGGSCRDRKASSDRR